MRSRTRRPRGAERVERDRIECDFRRRAAYAYATSILRALPSRVGGGRGCRSRPPGVDDRHGPVAVRRRGGGAVRRPGGVPRPPLPPRPGRRPDRRRLPNLRATRAVEVDSHQQPAVVKTPGGRVIADQVVVATHYPFLDRSLAFARVHPERSYAILCRIVGTAPDGMLISAGSPTRSVRAVPVDGEELLLVGGEGHRTGTGGDTEQRYRALEAFAHEHWDVQSIDYRWSAQDNTTVDNVPYVGRLSPREDRVFMATGFAKWGMTGGTAAALLFSDLLLGRDNRWATLFDPNRLTVRASAPRLVKENLQAGLRFVGDRLTKPAAAQPTTCARERATSCASTTNAWPATATGRRLHAVSPTCTHLGCQLNFNAAERSWDCPCHGSRFAPDGSVLQGPAVHRLERKPVN